MSEGLSHKDAMLQLGKEKRRVENLKGHQSRVQKELTTAMQEVKRLKDYLESPNLGIDVSDHAIVRYVERFMEVDIDRIKKNIVTEEIKIKHSIAGDGVYPLGGGLSTVITSNVAVTVLRNGK